MGNSLIRKLPVLLAVTERDRPVLTFVASAAAPGTTAPVVSFTSPAIAPLIVCPKPGRLKQIDSTETRTPRRHVDRMHFPLRNRFHFTYWLADQFSSDCGKVNTFAMRLRMTRGQRGRRKDAQAGHFTGGRNKINRSDAIFN